MFPQRSVDPQCPAIAAPAAEAFSLWQVVAMIGLGLLCEFLLLVGAYLLGCCDLVAAAVSSDSESAGRHRVVWQCNLANSDEKAWWVDYPETENEVIEKAWNKCSEWATLFDWDNEPRWRISFVRMMQLTQPPDCSEHEVTNARPIRRIIVSHA